MPPPTKPLLLLDVDGVLVPFGPQDGFLPLPDDEFAWYSPANATRLEQLRRYFDPVWATSWEHQANGDLATVHRLPPLPVIEFARTLPAAVALPARPGDPPDAPTEYVDSPKLAAIAAYAGERALAWVDDEIREDDRIWAQRRLAPTKLVHTDSTIGLTDEHVAELVAWVDEAS